MGNQELAIEYIRRAIGINRTEAVFHNNLGEAYRALRKMPQAAACYRQALKLKPNYAEAHNNLGIALQAQGKLEEAVACYRRALNLKPDFAEARNNLGNALREQGKLDDAVRCYRRVLDLNPDFAEAHNNLGNALREQGKLDEAAASYRRALDLKPDLAEAHNGLGNVLRKQGKLNDAEACFRRALDLEQDLAEAHDNLGNVLKEQGRLDEAVARYRRALDLKPDFAEAYNNLGIAFKEQGKLDEAVACYRRVLELNPDFAETHNNLGNALKEQGKLDEAVACYRRVLDLNPDLAEAHNNLGIALKEQGKLNEAVACYRRTLGLTPDFAEAHNNLGAAFHEQGKLDEAVACYRRVLELKPDLAEAHNNLGIVLKEQGKLDEAVACYRRALELKPGYVRAHSNLIYTQMFCADYNPQTLYEEHCRWEQIHAAPLAKFVQPDGNDRSPDRRLRVGYVSPDFRYHPVARFLLPLLESHDRTGFEIFCYASVRIQDAMTGRCRAHADVWRNVLGLPDAQVADAIRKDGIDILVDLSMHMAENRLLVFARKPAPVQVTYLAYCGTTGLRTIDYRLTDPYLDPPGLDDRFYSEQSVRLPETYWCYRPPMETPPVNALPAAEAGHVTFGSLNNFCKMSPQTLAAWTRLLTAVPESRLFLHAHSGSIRDHVRSLVAGEGISADRVDFVGFQPLAEYFDVYQRIDVALDPFPYGGGTTTCDALWMGVPVVSLAGQTAVGRSGVSILSNLGLTELVANDLDQYLRIAIGLAQDLPRLGNLRAALRERMQNSPLMDAPCFAHNIEAAYREMWRTWCSGNTD